MNELNDLTKMNELIVTQNMEDRNREMAELITAKRNDAKVAEERYQKAMKSIEASGINVSNLNALDLEFSEQSNNELLSIEAQMEESSQVSNITEEIDVERAFMPQDANVFTPSFIGAFSDDDVQDELTSVTSSEISAQAVYSGGACKNQYNWAKGGGSGLFGSGVGKIQTWVDFGFWFKPSTSKFYSINPLFRFRGFVIVKSNDGFFTSKYARVKGTAWTNVYQYNWKGWNNVTVYDNGGGNINLNTRRDIDRRTYNSYLLGGGDWAYVKCTIGLYAYARGGGSYAKNDFSTGGANYLCVPSVYVY